MPGTPSQGGRFAERYLPAEPLLRAYLHAATGDVHEAEDLLQQVSRLLWERFGEYDAARPFAAWAIGFARVQVLRWRDAQARDRRLLSHQALEELAAAAERFADPEPADLRAALLPECLQALPERARRVLAMKYTDGLAIREIARRVGSEVGAVEMMLVRSRRALRDCLERKMRERG